MREIAHHLLDVGFAFELLAHLLDCAREHSQLAACPCLQAHIWFARRDALRTHREIRDRAGDVTRQHIGQGGREQDRDRTRNEQMPK